MRVLRWLFILFLLCFLAVLVALIWIQTSRGAKTVSGCLTKQVQAAVPGTRVDLERLKLRWPPALAAEQAVWSDAASRPILHLARVRLALDRSGWEASGEVARLDLAALDRAVVRGELGANGFLGGSVRFRSEKGRPEDLDLKLQSQQPGGNINSKLLESLVEMMPANDVRGILLKALKDKAAFHFDVGKLDLTTEGDRRVLRLLLDGDHLLDLTLRIPKEIEDFSQLLHQFLSGA